MELAARFSGQIISADSVQIYRHMDIGTAKASAADQLLVTHHLLDISDPDQPYDAGRFVADADQAIAKVQAEGGLPVFVGGTHLYLKALVHGLIPTPEIEPSLKQSLYDRLATEGAPCLYEELSALDPETAARLDPNDGARITRALGVQHSTGRSISQWHQEHDFSEQRYQPFYLCVNHEREELYRRINRRVEEMVASGLVAETQGLLDRGFSADLPSLNSIGYKQAVSYLKGELSHDEMIEQIQRFTRRYAKKQLTWIKKMPQIHWVTPGTFDSAYLAVKDFLETTTESK